jgi:hypothetical protein
MFSYDDGQQPIVDGSDDGEELMPTIPYPYLEQASLGHTSSLLDTRPSIPDDLAHSQTQTPDCGGFKLPRRLSWTISMMDESDAHDVS